ncbi:hypothetical protein [Legionella micdadei]|uniref:Uncharacterized protein n=1 Tax=Legionella micdadei TaxID=451 RepID=A0A098GDA6_LEGMI|nr:hypothetical protein [Legionella micdadei]ARG98328.1 hypothetical protein B6N58_12005 [Legionella micdadei]ARH01079.1 hypothetical protein B6V88_12010 [Legionella micdadei]KTD27258.1 hypothetical protein Lmic_2193 [Legionella micdadei]NSL18645.1 hypothetical protein [Legionella micdadei]CEG60000.1 protein of unknown function [Legionella micdadei]
MPIADENAPKNDTKELFLCLTDKSIRFEKIDESVCVFNRENYRYSSNNQAESKNPLLAAEFAVFSGNLLRLILGNFQPEYYLAINSKDRKIYRIGTEVANYKDWCEVVHVDNSREGSLFLRWDTEDEQDILNLNIRGLTAILVACYFLGEADWADNNFGFVKVEDGFIVVRLDPGYSFNSSIINNCTVNLEHLMGNLLLNFIAKETSGENSECQYLSDIIDYEREEVRNSAAKIMFSNKSEIISTVKRIVDIDAEDLHQIKERSFVKNHYGLADKLINKLIQRQYLFKQFLNRLEEELPKLDEGKLIQNIPHVENTLDTTNPSNQTSFKFFPTETKQDSHKRRDDAASLSGVAHSKKSRI